jgi:enoyl-CoA hydratase/carnithine racemase
VLRADELRERLADPAWCEAPITDGESPLVVVALEDPGFPLGTPAPPWRVVVGIGRGADPVCDVVLTDDGDGALAAIEATCNAAPLAAATLTQVLRAGDELDVTDALVLESVAYSMLQAGSEFRAWMAAQPARTLKPAPEPVLVEHDGDTWNVVLNRPDVHNAYSAALRDSLVDVLRAAALMEPPPSVVIRGNGPSFSSGGDLAEFGTTPDPVLAHGIRTSRGPGLLLQRLQATARVHGACVGAGVELPAFCPRVEAHPDTTFLLPEVGMGLIPGAGGTVSITRRIGRHRTALLALTATAIDAPTALAWGLVDGVSS